MNERNIHFDSQNKNIILPVQEDDFRKFISGLLGKPQKNESRYDITFTLDITDIENIYYLVNQRVMQQNEAILALFSISMYYDDNTSVTMNSIDDFMSYKELRPLSVVNIIISWVYLLKFQDRSVSERQMIDVAISTENSMVINSKPSETGSLSRIFKTPKEYNVLVSISHTARTWAADISNLLDGQIKKWDIGKFSDSIILQNKGKIIIGTLLTFASTMIYWIYLDNTAERIKINKYIDNASKSNIDQKIQFLFDMKIVDLEKK
jgi:hypothetical protein